MHVTMEYRPWYVLWMLKKVRIFELHSPPDTTFQEAHEMVEMIRSSGARATLTQNDEP